MCYFEYIDNNSRTLQSLIFFLEKKNKSHRSRTWKCRTAWRKQKSLCSSRWKRRAFGDVSFHSGFFLHKYFLISSFFSIVFPFVYFFDCLTLHCTFVSYPPGGHMLLPSTRAFHGNSKGKARYQVSSEQHFPQEVDTAPTELLRRLCDLGSPWHWIHISCHWHTTMLKPSFLWICFHSV